MPCGDRTALASVVAWFRSRVSCGACSRRIWFEGLRSLPVARRSRWHQLVSDEQLHPRCARALVTLAARTARPGIDPVAELRAAATAGWQVRVLDRKAVTS